MKITLHEKAAKCFNDKICAFLYELKPDELNQNQKDRQQRAKRPHRKSSASEVYISGILTERDITNIPSLGYIDHQSGKQMARFFPTPKGPIGLNRNVYEEFEAFIEKLHGRREINRFLSRDFLRDCAFEWFEKQYQGVLRDNKDWIAFLAEKAEIAIASLKVSIPISFLIIERPFTVGAITFEYFEREFYDRYIDRFRENAGECTSRDRDKFRAFETRFRKQYQGRVFGSMVVEAEPKQCVQIATSEVEKSLMVLRFFSPTASVPEIPCYFGRMGHTHLPADHSFVFHDELPAIGEGTAEKRAYEWGLSDRQVSELEKLGLRTASDLILRDKPTKFEDLVLSSLFFFTRSLTSTCFQDRIVYALVSVETILLRNQTEPIQSSIGLRLAFLTESDPKQRKKVKDLITKAYKLRSSYIHHGKRGEDWVLLQDLQHAVWSGISEALLSTRKFAAQEHFLEHIDSIVLR